MKITANIQGGLGNQLFILFTTIAYCIKFGFKYEFVRSDVSPSCTFRTTYWKTILSKIPTVEALSFNPEIVYSDIDENVYNEIPDLRQYNKNICFNGYFQSHRYFDRIYPLILSSINSIDAIYINHLNSIFRMIKIEAAGSPIVFIHVRHGDYYIYSNILSMDYYKEAIGHFDPDTFYVIFSDDINYCKENFAFLSKKKFIEEQDFIELLLMSKMDGAIIANSTFSWWGAYLMDPKKSKKVVAPKNWKKDSLLRNDRYLPHWIII